MVSVVSSRTVRPPPLPRRRIPLTTWDVPMLSANYIQKGLLFHNPTGTLLPTTAHVVDHLAAALADALVEYYPVAGRFVNDRHYGGEHGDVVVGCSVSIDCDGQGVQVVHAVADVGVSLADVIPPDVDVPVVVHSFFLLDGAINYDGRGHPLLGVQVTDLADGVFVGFSYNHALSDGTAFWGFINAWADIARARLLGSPREQPLRRPLLDRWSPDGGVAAPVVLPCAEVSDLIERTPQTQLRERMLHFSPESLVALKEKDPPAYMMSWHDPCGMLMGSSPRFDMFGCDFGWGKPVAARSGKANKVNGGTSLYPCPDGGGGMDAELTLTPEHMAALEEDEEFWAAVSPDAPGKV